MNDVLNEYRDLLQDGERHISESAFSSYINLFSELSTSERDYINQHLNQCEQCRSRFEKIFDEEFEFDTAVETLELPNVESPAENTTFWKYRNSHRAIEIQLESSTSALNQLVFTQLSEALTGASVRIIIPNTGLTIRIVYAETGKKYTFPNAFVEVTHPPNHLELEWLPRDFESSLHESAEQPASAWRWYAAAAAILLTLSASLFFLLDRPGYIAESGQTVEKQVDDRQAFAPHPVLENFIHRRLRGKAFIEMLSPSIGDTVQSPIKFQWKGSANTYRITILSNRNAQLWNKKVDEHQATFFGDLSPGLYYWKISSGNTLLGVGKFVVM